MKTKKLTAIEAYKKMKETEDSIEDAPWNVYRMLGTGQQRKIDVAVSSLQIVENADFGTIEDCRQAIEWLALQLGGEVKWKQKY